MIRTSTLSLLFALFWNQANGQMADAGKASYNARCVGCHGADGTGGGHGPNIKDVVRPRATSKEAVRELILNGIPNRGMPAFKIPIEEADAIAAYVMALLKAASTNAANEPAPGDPVAGERFFAGKGNCTSCHM